MVSTAAPSLVSFNDRFLKSLFEVADGERLRLCLQCGSCSGVCPYGDMMDFPPGKMIATLRAGVFEEVLEVDSTWLCISCYACTQICPEKIPITASLMTRAKEEMILAGHVPAELQMALENSQRYGNVLGQSPRKRGDWVQGVQFKVPILGRDKRSTDILWFVGDYGSYHPRVQSVSRAIARILHTLGIDYAILGSEEVSDGDSQRLAGEKGLFEYLAEKNQKAFSKFEFNKIVTSDPHAFNALKNEYPKLGYSYPVQHISQFLAERIDQLKPFLTKEVKALVTFHDPCYLGRVNGIFDEPRELLKAIPGVDLVEMSHHRLTSLCCGGGGGGMWLDGFLWEKAHARTTEWRIQEAVTCRADIFAVACPYEPPRFEDAAKTVKGGERLVVKDIVELIADALGE